MTVTKIKKGWGHELIFASEPEYCGKFLNFNEGAKFSMHYHRDKDETGEKSRVNTTDVLIEKHRNGATGRVELYFNDKKATFQSIEKSDYGAGAGDDFDDF